MMSVSTLFRRARESKNPKTAAKLRKQAALLRKGARKTAKVKNSTSRAERAEVEKIRMTISRDIDSHKRFVELDDARFRELDEKHREQLRTIRETNQINVICAFIADMEGSAALNGGVLPPSVMVSGFTVARILEALRASGYDTEGKRGVNRDDIIKNSA